MLDELKNWLKDPENDSVKQRAELLEDIVHVFYDFSKFERPGGEGLDGRNGPERRGLAKVLDAVINYHDSVK